MRNVWWFTIEPSLVPEGLILPFNNTVADIPSGWEQFGGTGSGIFDGNKAIKGSSGEVATRGSIWGNMQSSSAGLHGGNGVDVFFANESWSNPDASCPQRTDIGRGNHSHSTMFSYEIKRSDQVFIKSTESSGNIPMDAGVLSIETQSDMTDITDTGYTLGVQTAITGPTIFAREGPTNWTSGSDYQGEHHHHIYNTLGSSLGTAVATTQYQSNAGPWNHSSTMSLTDNLKRFYFSVWSSATEDVPLGAGMFGMWESSTPPEGWAICDGTNDTPDLVDHFVGFDTAKAGTSDGDGTIAVSGNLASTGTHDHQVAALTAAPAIGKHDSGYAHSHTQSYNGAFEPPHYTLVFIKYLG